MKHWLLAFCLAALSAFAGTTPQMAGIIASSYHASTGFPSGWSRKCPLVIDHTKVSAAVAAPAHFPVLVSYRTVGTATNLPDECMLTAGTYAAKSDGGDIRFTSDSAGTVPLHSEVVTFALADPVTNASAEIWVNVPALSASADTTIYVFYHNAAATMPTANDASWGSQGVWDANFAGVWHLRETGTGAAADYKDSTSNANDSTNTTGQPAAATAKIGKGQTTNGSSTYVDVGMAASLQLGTTGTVSTWFYPHTAFAFAHMVSDMNAATGHNGYAIFTAVYATQFKVGIGSATVNKGIGDTGVSTLDTWYYGTSTWDGTNLNIYTNGAYINHVAQVTPVTNAYDVSFGRSGEGASWFTGSLDEVRISNIARSADWILTEYNNQNAPTSFLTVGTPGAP